MFVFFWVYLYSVPNKYIFSIYYVASNALWAENHGKPKFYYQGVAMPMEGTG